MKIIIVGCGNVGATLTEQLSKENHDVTIIDTREQRVSDVSNSFDVMGVVGNGTSLSVLREAGVEEADLLIAVTGMDEHNLLCCLIARKAGGCQTIARVSNPVYNDEIAFIRDEMEISMIINPQATVAREMARQLRYPSALKVDSFAKSRVELVTYRLPEGNLLCDTKLKDLGSRIKGDILIPIVERKDEVIIPDGNFELKAKDIITLIGTTPRLMEFFKSIGEPTTRAKDVLLIGAGRTAIYLTKQLLDMGLKVKVIEDNMEECENMCELFPKATIICGDPTDKNLLQEEGIRDAEAIITNTTIDEENIMLSLYAKSCSKARVITKIHRISYDEIIQDLNIGSVIYPKFITAEAIIKYVRAMKNSIGSQMESLYRLNNNRVEALELIIRENSPIVGIPLQDLRLQKDVLIGCISRGGKAMIPDGRSTVEVGDTIILVTTRTGIHDIQDALK